MPTVIDQVTAEVVDQPQQQPAQPQQQGRQAPDMARIRQELRRDMERCQRLWCD